MTENLLEISHLTHKFPINRRESLTALDDVSFTLRRGEIFGLVGESGSGKSTLARCVMNVYRPTAGKILFNGIETTDPRAFRKNRAYLQSARQIIFQDSNSSLDPKWQAWQVIAEPMRLQHVTPKRGSYRAEAEFQMHYVGLDPLYLDKYPPELSGGQRQRLAIARALTMEPELLVADEPIAALDVSIQAQIVNLFGELKEKLGLTYLFIAHDLSIVRFISDRIGIIYKGDIVEVAEAEELFDFPMHPYTHSLISAIPIPDPQLEKNKELYTYDPSIHDYSVDKPELVDIGNNHLVYGNKAEIEHYKKLRAEGKKVKSITILTPEEKAKRDAEAKQEPVSEVILDRPLHDSGSIWFRLLAFLLPILGLIAGQVYKSKNYINNFKALKKGAIAGLIFRLVLLIIFVLLIVISVL